MTRILTSPDYSRMDLERIREIAAANVPRVAALGEWPDYISPESITDRIPKADQVGPGFDAGLACALNIIPLDKQGISAKLHANYSPAVVAQVRDEMKDLKADSETCWWLSCCSLCKEGTTDAATFRQQLIDARKLQSDPEARLAAAKNEFENMLAKMFFTQAIGSDIPFGTEDGSAQGAYLAGYPVAVQYAANYGIYFVSTIHESLGLENFRWSEFKDADGRPCSGPVWGSKQFLLSVRINVN